MNCDGQETESSVIRPVVCGLALAASLAALALLGGTPPAAAAPPASSLSLPKPAPGPGNDQPSTTPPSSSSSGPLGAPLGGPQAAPQPGGAASGTKQDSAPAQQGGGSKAETLRASYDEAFQATLAHPSDPEVLVKFAELAVEYGDIEGAVSALERLLLIDDDQPEVKLELGVLYFRLGSKEAARMYLEAARSSSQASPETKEKAEKYLKADGVK
jgi:hypothetical protein